jgi:adenine deaminase
METSEWSRLTRQLVDVAMGREPADLVIRNGRWVCVQSGEIIKNTDIAVKGERIAYVGPDASHAIGEDTVIIEAQDRFLVPGLCDGHMHVESGMITVTEFVRAVLPHGTTAMFIDPHEIANVFGLKGVRLMKPAFNPSMYGCKCLLVCHLHLGWRRLGQKSVQTMLQKL